MRTPLPAVLVSLALSLSASALAAAAPAGTAHGGTGDAAAAVLAVETPELARPGTFTVGTQTITVAMPDRPSGAPAGVSRAPHELPIRLYYPAASAAGPRAVYHHVIALPAGAPFPVVEHGLAHDGAPVARGRSFPLVVVSHGFGGWATHFSRICEILASHGYVVAAIDHQDRHFDDVPGFAVSFGNVLLDRPADQRAAIAALSALAGSRSGVMAAVDPAAPIGLIGYSMGGYGAVGTAGAAYDPAAKPYAALAAGARQDIGGSDRAATRIGALVLMAPWGAQPDSRVWSRAAIAAITAPTLLIDGDRDEVVDYRQGVRWLFDSMTGADRRLLTLREAHHNIAGNAVTLPSGTRADVVGWFSEPVWRQERLNQVTAHFIVAFLDVTLGRRAAASAFLAVPTRESDDGAWPVAFGEQTGGSLSGAAQPRYWRGFARGWAGGMALEHKGKGE